MNKVLQRIEQFKVECDTCTDAASLNNLMEVAKQEQSIGDLRLRMANAIKERALQLGLTLNKETRIYE